MKMPGKEKFIYMRINDLHVVVYIIMVYIPVEPALVVCTVIMSL